MKPPRFGQLIVADQAMDSNRPRANNFNDCSNVTRALQSRMFAEERERALAGRADGEVVGGARDVGGQVSHLRDRIVALRRAVAEGERTMTPDIVVGEADTESGSRANDTG
jgi:hypothetical protein